MNLLQNKILKRSDNKYLVAYLTGYLSDFHSCNADYSGVRGFLSSRYPDTEIDTIISHFRLNNIFCDCEVLKFLESSCGCYHNQH